MAQEFTATIKVKVKYFSSAGMFMYSLGGQLYSVMSLNKSFFFNTRFLSRMQSHTYLANP